MKQRIISLHWLALVALFIGLLPVQASFAQDEGVTQGEVVAEGLNGPMGVLVDPNGDLWIVDSGLGGDAQVEGFDFTGQAITGNYGPTARIVKVALADGAMTEVAALTSVSNGTENEGGSRLALLDGALYATGAGWHPAVIPSTAEAPLPGTGSLWRIEANGTVREAAALWQLERDHNPVGAEVDNHPYGLLAGADSKLWVVDAGMNALLTFDPATGDATIVAQFDPIPGVFPNPNYDNALLTDAVPTGVAVADGAVYVSFLSGAPFIPGSAKVVTVAEDGAVSDYATGLTMLTDLRTGPDGALYATQFGLFTEQGPAPGSGAVIRILPGDASEVVVQGLAFPTSLDFNADGDAFVTVNGVGAPGSGQVVKFAGLTGMAGAPVAEIMAALALSGGEAAAESAPAEEAPAAPASSTETAVTTTPVEPTPTAMPVTGGAGPTGALAVTLVLGAGLAALLWLGRRRSAA
jgi:sugar lactone lactonase YvrE